MKTALKMTLYSWALILLVAWLLTIHDRIEHVSTMQRVAAWFFLIAILCDIVYELGWGGGDRNA